jgi:hypothetical protein
LARRTSVLPATVVRTPRLRTSPRIPNARISRSTVCLDTGGRPCAARARFSQSVIFRRPYMTSGARRPPGPALPSARSRSQISASLTVRAAGGRVFQAR